MISEKIYSCSYLKLIFLAILISNVNISAAQIDTTWIQQQSTISRKAYEESNRNKEKLINVAKWNLNRMPGMVYLKNPMEETPTMRDYGCYHIPFCVDILPNTSDFADFRCTVNSSYTHSYNGSTGTLFEYAQSDYDYMQSNPARVVAAASGVIVAKTDGFGDLNCSYTPNSNYLIIEHSDGRRTGYYHLRNGLITQKNIGDVINEGEPIGYPGGFHGSFMQAPASANLFFELRDANNNVVDPFGCVNNGGLWTYSPCSWRDSIEMKNMVAAPALKLLKTMKHLPTTTDNCGKSVYVYNDNFNPGDPFYVRYVLTNYDRYNDSIVINVYNPAGVPILPTFTRPKICSNCGTDVVLITEVQGISYVLPTNAFMIPGTYSIVLNHADRYGSYSNTYYQYFTVGCVGDYSFSSTVNGTAGTTAGNNIYSTQTCNSGSRVTYVAGNEIILQPNFIAYNGSTVMIYNDPCIVPARMGDETETDKVSNNKEITLSPNPANSAFKIQSSELLSSVDIYNVVGERIYSYSDINSKSIEIDLSANAKGIYFVKINSQVNSTTKKIVLE